MKNNYKIKTFERIVLDALKKGWKVNTDYFVKGSDWISIRDMYALVPSNEGIPRHISYNTTNGHFFVYEASSNEPIATHLSKELDNEDWYNEILDLFYETVAT